jgi:hypothetical protein
MALLAVSGCATLKKTFRKPGEKLESFPEAVWEEYDCDSQKRPFFIIEENELVPEKVSPGGDFNHRMIYVMCPRQATETVQGDLQTRIRFRGSPIVRKTTKAYEIKPGRWIVDSEVVLPEEAEPGVYAFELAFKSRSLSFDKSLTFVVTPR